MGNWPALGVFLALLAVVGLPGCEEPSGKLLQFSGPTMGTTYTVKVAAAPDSVTADALQAGVNRVLAQVNKQISTYDKESELSRLNQNPSADWIEVSPDLLSVVEEAQRISDLSGGAFDITVGPLVNLWGFGPEMKEDAIPADEAIKQARDRVGYQRVHARSSPPAIRKDRPDIYIDLSALGEGFGADKVAEYLEAQGVANYMVAVAGAIRVKGHNAKDTAWAIAIEEPTPGKRAVYRIMQITNEGLSTSGDYRNFFEKDGKRYSHEIDPKTGRPIEHGLASVTVVGQTAMHADGMATALMVMGPEQGLHLAEAQNLATYFIVKTSTGFTASNTKAFNQYLAQ